MSSINPVDIAKMDALRKAEALACRHPESHAVVYRRIEERAETARFFVRMAGEDVPEDAEAVTTVSRKPVHRPVSQWGLQDAVKHMVDNMPQGLRLADRVLVERYPNSSRYMGQDPPIFAYQFFSTEGLNVGTWIPDACANGVVFQSGVDGRGRAFPGAFAAGQVTGPTEHIGALIDAAQAKETGLDEAP